MDILKWGLLYKRNVSQGWLKDLLAAEKIVDGSKASIHARFLSDYKAQDLFMQQGMQACMGDDFDPRLSKQGREAHGSFKNNKKSVPPELFNCEIFDSRMGHIVHDVKTHEEGSVWFTYREGGS